MHRLKFLTIVFDSNMRPHEIPAFRGAVSEKVGHKHTLFHNHVRDGYRYAYPLIQYKCLRGHPALICMGAGVDEIHHYFEKKDWSINISGRQMDMKVDSLDLNQFHLQVGENFFPYRIHNWMALNQANFHEYQQLGSLSKKVNYLEKKLIGNILSFAKGIGWWIDKDQTIQVEILDLKEPKRVKFKGKYMEAFSLNFQTNVFLPNYIGLGKGVSKGFGIIHSQRNN